MTSVLTTLLSWMRSAPGTRVSLMWEENGTLHVELETPDGKVYRKRDRVPSYAIVKLLDRILPTN